MNENLKYYPINEMDNVKILGRTNEDVYPLPLFWNNSGVEVNVEASELWIDVEVGSDYFEPWVATEINGALISRQMLLEGEHSICIFRSMTPSVVKNVKFFRETQALNENLKCHITVKGFRTDGKFLPVDKNKLKIEFVGDSITSGEGTYGAQGDSDWLPMYMSSSRNYANIIGHYLNADIRLISSGGWGFYSGWDNNTRCNIPSIYEKVCGISTGPINEAMGSLNDYDFSSFVTDAVVINLGTNDASAFDQPAFDVPGEGLKKLRRNEDGTLNEEDCDMLTKAVSDFLKVVRKHNPKAHIVWCYGMFSYELGLTISRGVSNYSIETGDREVSYFTLPNTAEEEQGSRFHPGIIAHEKTAAMLTDLLKQKLHIQ